LPGLHGGDRGRAGAGTFLPAHAHAGNDGQGGERAGDQGAAHGDGAARRRPAAARGEPRPREQALALGRPRRCPRKPVAEGRALGTGPEPPGHGRQSRGLHPVHALRARLPRGAGQRRDRHGVPGPRREGRLRPGRPDGQLDLRRLRRVRPGLPDRCPDAGLHHGRGGDRRPERRPRGPERLPVLRRRLPADLPRQGRRDPLRHRCQRPGQREPALRQGPVRFRLCPSSRTPDRAADPQGRGAEARGDQVDPANPWTHFREATWEEALERAATGLVPSATRMVATRWPGSGRPNAPTRRPISSRSWCAPAFGPTMSTTAPGSATPRRWRP
jgi:hypothetical protein